MQWRALTRFSRVDSLYMGTPGQTFPPRSAFTSCPRRLARPRTPPFHGDNTGSNPVGDANRINYLQSTSRIF